MNKTDIRRIIKEEISRALNEIKPKFKPGDHFKYMGTDHEVIEDNGFIITALTKHGDRVKLNHNQLKNSIFESNLKNMLPAGPGTYKIEFTTAKRDSFDEATVNITQDQMDRAERMETSAYNFWRDIAENSDPFFTNGDSVLNVTKIN